MSTYHLEIITADGLCYDGPAEKLLVRTTSGDVCILPRHINYASALGMGVARVTADGKTRPAACIGGMLSVLDGRVRLLASTFEWAEDIDVERAQRAEAEAKAALEQGQLSGEARDLAEARLRRARVRLSAAGQRTD